MFNPKILKSRPILVFGTYLLLTLGRYGAECCDLKSKRCCSKLASLDINPDRFCFYITHGLHSLKIEDVKRYVGVDLPDKNFIPTVSYDLNDTVYHHLPRMATKNTDGLSYMQFLDSHLSSPKYWKLRGETFGLGMLEAMAHSAHMHDVWTQMKPLYEKIEKSPPDGEACRCLSDDSNNGIFDALEVYRSLRWQNRQMVELSEGTDVVRIPFQWYGRRIFANSTCGSVKDHGYDGKDGSKTNQGSFHGQSFKGIQNAKTWNMWKAVLEKNLPRKEEIYQFAMYLYCKLRPYAK